MSNKTILYPEHVYAYRIGNDPKVTIVAQGHEDGVQNIKIVPSLATIYPPIYMVEGEFSPAIGYFPYTVKTTVNYATDLDYVQFQMANGTQRIPVRDILQDEATAPSPKAMDAVSGSNPNQVVGYAYNSSDISKAISDAVTKLQAKFPGKVNAELVSSGFVGVGQPVGIAYYYVVMEQK